MDVCLGASWDLPSPGSITLTTLQKSLACWPSFIWATNPLLNEKGKERKAWKRFWVLSLRWCYSLINLPLWKFSFAVLFAVFKSEEFHTSQMLSNALGGLVGVAFSMAPDQLTPQHSWHLFKYQAL